MACSAQSFPCFGASEAFGMRGEAERMQSVLQRAAQNDYGVVPSHAE